VVEPYVPGEHREAQETEPLAAEKEAKLLAQQAAGASAKHKEESPGK